MKRRAVSVLTVVLCLIFATPVAAETVEESDDSDHFPFYFEVAASPYSQYSMTDFNAYVQQHNTTHPSTYFDEVDSGVFINLEGGWLFPFRDADPSPALSLGGAISGMRVNPASSPNHTLEVETVGLGPTARLFAPLAFGADHGLMLDVRGELAGLFTSGYIGDGQRYTIIPVGDFRGFGYMGVLTGGLSYYSSRFKDLVPGSGTVGIGLDVGYRHGRVPTVKYSDGTHDGEYLRTCAEGDDGGCLYEPAEEPDHFGDEIGMDFSGYFLRIKLLYLHF